MMQILSQTLYISIVFVITTSVFGQDAPQSYSENFDAVTEFSLPAGWGEYNQTDASQGGIGHGDEFLGWTVVTPTTLAALGANRVNVTSVYSGNSIYAESDVRSGIQVQYLYTPNYDLSAIQDSVSIAFDSNFMQNQDSINFIEYTLQGDRITIGANGEVSGMNDVEWLPLFYWVDASELPQYTVNGELDSNRLFTEQGLDDNVNYAYKLYVGAGSLGSLAPYVHGRSQDDNTTWKRHETFDVPNAAGQKNVRFRMLQGGGGSWFWGIDNWVVGSTSEIQAPFFIRRNASKYVVGQVDTFTIEIVCTPKSTQLSELNVTEHLPQNVQVSNIRSTIGSVSLNRSGDLVWIASNVTGRHVLYYTLNVNWPESGGMYLTGQANDGGNYETDIMDDLIIVSDLETEDEFNGSFTSWMDLKKDFGAVGDGVADDTSALQNAFDRLKADGRNNAADCVLFIPSGNYRITKSLELLGTSHFEANGFEIIGEDPSNTTIFWDGNIGYPMIRFGGWYCKVSRVTLDGEGKAETGILWGPRFSIFSELSDVTFRNLDVGVQGGIIDASGIDSVTTLRCKFIRCAKAGISIENWNSLNWFVWDSVFEYCGRAVTNVFGAGTFHVYNCLIYKSSIADFGINMPENISLRGNTSIQSRSFCTTLNSSHCLMLTIEGNKIYDPLATPINAIGTTSLSFYDNLVKYNQTPSIAMNHSQSSLLATGNTFTSDNPISSNEDSILFENEIVEGNSVQIEYPKLPKTPKFISRTVFEVPQYSEDEEIQSIIDQAASLIGQRPIIHFQSGTYYIKRTLMIPENADMQFCGEDSTRTTLSWSGPNNGLLMKINGPSQVRLHNLHIYGPTIYLDEGNETNGHGILIDNCDQLNSRVFIEQVYFSDEHDTNTGDALSVDKILNLDLSLLNTQFYNQFLNIIVTGNGDLTSSRNSSGRVSLFSGVNTITTGGCYAINDGGRLVVKDTRYEQYFPERTKFVLGSGDIDFSLECSEIHPIEYYILNEPFGNNTPMVELNNFGGNASFLNNHFLYREIMKYIPSPIVLTDGKSSSNLLVLGSSFSQNDERLTQTNSNSTVRMHGLFSTVGGSHRLDNTDQVDAEWIKKMMAHSREMRPRPLVVMQEDGVTDVQMQRVRIDKMKYGLKISGSKVDSQNPEYPQLGVFEKSVDWRRYGNYKAYGTIGVGNENGDRTYTIGGNGDGIGKRDVGSPNDVDEAFYTYKELTGNWSIQANIEWLEKAIVSIHSHPSVGLMIREKGARTTSKCCYLTIPRNEDIYCQWRSTETELLQTVHAGMYGSSLPPELSYDSKYWNWLRLSRIDRSTFKFEISPDGFKWYEIYRQTIEMSDSVSYGVVICNGWDDQSLATAKLTNVKLIPTDETIPTQTPTSTLRPTNTPRPTYTPTPSRTFTVTPTYTARATSTSTPTRPSILTPTPGQTSTSTPTFAPTEFPEPTATPLPLMFIDFDHEDLVNNRLIIGDVSGYERATVMDAVIPTLLDSDGYGLTITANPGQGAVIFPAVDVDLGGKPGLLRVLFGSNAPGAQVALAGLNSPVDGQLAYSNPIGGAVPVGDYRELILIYKPPTSRVLPFLQVVVPPESENAVTVYFDRLIVEQLPGWPEQLAPINLSPDGDFESGADGTVTNVANLENHGLVDVSHVGQDTSVYLSITTDEDAANIGIFGEDIDLPSTVMAQVDVRHVIGEGSTCMLIVTNALESLGLFEFNAPVGLPERTLRFAGRMEYPGLIPPLVVVQNAGPGVRSLLEVDNLMIQQVNAPIVGGTE